MAGGFVEAEADQVGAFAVVRDFGRGGVDQFKDESARPEQAGLIEQAGAALAGEVSSGAEVVEIGTAGAAAI